MKPPLFVRPLTAAEQAAVQGGLRSADAFTLRRCQILAASAKGQRPAQIAAALGCATQTVRDALRAFHAEGAACLRPKSKAPKTVHTAWPRRRPPRPVAPVPPRLRQAAQPVDARPGGPGLPRAGLDPAPCQRRDDPAGPEAPGGVLEAGQALAHLPRPAVRAKKKSARR